MIVWNSIIDFCLPFMSNQWYFQNQSCFVNTVPHPVPSSSVSFLFSQISISFVPGKNIFISKAFKKTVLKIVQGQFEQYHKMFHFVSYCLIWYIYSSLLTGKINEKMCNDIDTRCLCYKTFYSNNLNYFVISWSVCPWQDFPAKSYVWR